SRSSTLRGDEGRVGRCGHPEDRPEGEESAGGVGHDRAVNARDALEDRGSDVKQIRVAEQVVKSLLRVARGRAGRRREDISGRDQVLRGLELVEDDEQRTSTLL